MELKFEVNGIMNRPIAEVYEAVADPDVMSKYFITGGSNGRMETCKTLMWEFADFPGAFPVNVVLAEPHDKIIFTWGTADPEDQHSKTTTIFTFESLPDQRTRILVTEDGWRETSSGLKASYNNCMGWSQMLCAMKAWLEHGINLREGMYK